MERIKEGLTKAGISYVSECMGGNIEGLRIGSVYVLEHGSGKGYYFGNLEDSDDTCYTLDEVIKLVKDEEGRMRITVKLYDEDMRQYTAFLRRNGIWYEYRMEEHFLWRIRTEELTADQHETILDYLNKQEVKQ